MNESFDVIVVCGGGPHAFEAHVDRYIQSALGKLA
jgi:hypothetical protein